MQSEIEEWRAVVGYEGWYEVSNQGRVRRLKAAKGANVGRVLKEHTHRQGYRQVNLTCDASNKVIKIHRLVALAFLGTPPSGQVVNHIDGDKSNNRLNNLEYVSRGRNLQHAYELKLRATVHMRGELNGNTKLTAEKILEIRTLSASLTQRQIAERFQIGQAQVCRIINGKRWKHVA